MENVAIVAAILSPELDLRVAARNVATFAGAWRLFGLGFRAARSGQSFSRGLIYQSRRHLRSSRVVQIRLEHIYEFQWVKPIPHGYS